MSGMTSPTSIRISPLGNMNPNVPLFDQSGEAAKILGAYGLQGPQISQDPIFQRTQDGDGSFLGMHPNFRSAMSGAIMGAAFTPPSMTPGQGINNVAQGLIGAQDFTRQRQMGQFMSPFSVANVLSEIQGRQGQLDYLHGLGQFYGHRLDNQRQVLATHQTVDGKLFNVMESGETEWVKDPTGQILVGPPAASQRPRAGDHPGGLSGQIVESMVGPPPDSSDPKALADWGNRAAEAYTRLQGNMAGSRAAGTQAGKESDPHYVAPDQASRIKLYSEHAREDIKSTEDELKLLMQKHASSQAPRIAQLHEELARKKTSYGGYAAALLEGQDVKWEQFLSGPQQPNSSPQQGAPQLVNPFRH